MIKLMVIRSGLRNSGLILKLIVGLLLFIIRFIAALLLDGSAISEN